MWTLEVPIPLVFLLPLPMVGSWRSQTQGCVSDTPGRDVVSYLPGADIGEKQDLISEPGGTQFVE